MTKSSLPPGSKEKRRFGLGGSDVGTVLGLNKWKSPIDLWMEKTGRSEPADIGDLPHVHWGIVLEPVVRSAFETETGLTVHDAGGIAYWSQDKRILGHADGLVVDDDGDVFAGFEAKTASAWTQQDWGPYDIGSREYGNNVPLSYLCQCLHYMIVYDLPRWYLAVLIGGFDFRVYHIERDPELEKELLRRELEFLAHVEHDTPPEATSIADVVTLYPKSLPREVVADGFVMGLLEKASEADSNGKQWRGIADGAKKDIAAFMGDAEKLVDSSGATLATFASHERTSIDSARLKAERPDVYAEFSKTSTVRPFRIN